MTTEATSSGTTLEQPSAVVPFSALVESATLEFHAALQLLAERTRFLTAADGVAIAIGEGRNFIYGASVAGSVPAVHDVANAAAGIIGEVITGAKPVSGQSGPPFQLIVPIKRQHKVTGYFELASNRGRFGSHEIETVLRLAELAATALDVLEAAQQAESRIGPLQEKAERPGKPLWHAPETVVQSPPQGATASAPPEHAITEKCWWCGFPISQGRKLCVDCEEKNLASIAHETKPMFEFEKQESWIDAHGYTIATVLVSALAAVVIYLLR